MAGKLYITGGSNEDSADGDDQDDGDYDDDDSNDGDICSVFAAVADVKVVEMDSETIRHAPPMGIARKLHATTASATSFFVFGGVNLTGLLSSCEEFNLQTMR